MRYCSCSAPHRACFEGVRGRGRNGTVRELLWSRAAHSGRVECAPKRDRGIANRLEYAAGYQPRLKHMGPRENPSGWGGSGPLEYNMRKTAVDHGHPAPLLREGDFEENSDKGRSQWVMIDVSTCSQTPIVDAGPRTAKRRSLTPAYGAVRSARLEAFGPAWDRRNSLSSAFGGERAGSALGRRMSFNSRPSSARR